MAGSRPIPGSVVSTRSSRFRRVVRCRRRRRPGPRMDRSLPISDAARRGWTLHPGSRGPAATVERGAFQDGPVRGSRRSPSRIAFRLAIGRPRPSRRSRWSRPITMGRPSPRRSGRARSLRAPLSRGRRSRGQQDPRPGSPWKGHPPRGRQARGQRWSSGVVGETASRAPRRSPPMSAGSPGNSAAQRNGPMPATEQRPI